MNRYGKSIRAMNVVRYAMKTDKSLFIYTNIPEWWCDKIFKEFPEVKIIKSKEGIKIEKS